MLSSKDGRVALALGLLTALSYFPATQAGFVWDDVIITTLPAVRDWGGLWQLWFNPGDAYLHNGVGEGHYWPLTYSSFWLEHKLWGFSPVGYHVVNLLLHFVNTLLLWRLLAHLEAPAPWLVAALFAVHPVHVESVVWIIGRKDLLSSLFYFMAIMAWLRFVETGRAGRYVLSLALFVAALLCKSSVVTLPAALLALHWWKQGRLEARTLLQLGPFFAIGLMMTIADLSFYQGREQLALGYSMIERVQIAAAALWFYAGKLLWPTGLAVIYPHWEVGATDLQAWAYVIGVVTVVALCWGLRQRLGRGALAGIAYFIITLGPVLGFIDYGYMQFSFVADRYQYLAGIGLMALVVGAGVATAKRLDLLASRTQTVIAIAALPPLLLLGALTWKQSGIYRDELTFFSHISTLNPDAHRVYLNLAAALNGQGRAQEALTAARTAVQKEPGAADTQITLGLALLKLERYDEAERHLTRALDINPRSVNAMQNMADLLRRQGRYEAALEMFQETLALNPDSALLHAGMGYCLFRLGRYEETIVSIKQAFAMQPELAQTHRDLYLLLEWALHETSQTGAVDRHLAGRPGQITLNADDYVLLADSFRLQQDYERALAAYRRALEMEPEHGTGHAGMGDTLYRLQRYQEAAEVMQRALELQPDQLSAPALHYLSAESLRALGRPQQAQAHYEQALQLNPQMDAAANRLAELLVAQKRYPRALELYKALADSNPDDASAHSNAGVVLFMLDRTTEALSAFEQALSLDPAHENARTNLEQAKLRLQQEGE